MDVILSSQEVNATEVEEFNLALDKILECFCFVEPALQNDDTNGSMADDEELWRAQNAYDRLAADVRETDAQRRGLQPASSIPKVMKNDIRRYYSRMLMNTLNSADFTMLQDYFRTFMCQPCKFMVNISAPPELAIPNKIVVEGPRIISHFSLGCFVQFPDMVMSMTDSKIVTSNSWAGTKIVMQVQFRATKMYNIDIDSWLPQLATLSETYKAAQKGDALVEAIARNDHIDFSDIQINAPPQLNCSIVEKANLDSSLSLVSDNANDNTETQNIQGVSERCAGFHREVSVESFNECTPRTSPAPQNPHSGDLNRVSPSSLSDVVSGNNDRADVSAISDDTAGCVPRSATVGIKRKLGNQLADDEICFKEKSTESNSSTRSGDNPEYIPEAWVRSLMTRAELLPEPIPFLLQGEIIMFLDGNNHIQHMCETLVPVQNSESV